MTAPNCTFCLSRRAEFRYDQQPVCSRACASCLCSKHAPKQRSKRIGDELDNVHDVSQLRQYARSLLQQLQSNALVLQQYAQQVTHDQQLRTAYEAYARDLNSKRAEAESQLFGYQSQLNHTREALEAEREGNARLQAQVKPLDEQIALQELTIKALDDEKARLERELESAMQLVNTHDQAAKAKQRALEALEKRRADTESDLLDALVKLKETRKARQQQAADLLNAQERIEALERRAKSLDESLTRKEAVLALQVKSNQELTKQLAAETERSKKLSDELKDCAHQMREMERELREQMKALRRELEAKEVTLEKCNRDLEERRSSMLLSTQMPASGRQEILALKEQIDDLYAQKANATEQMGLIVQRDDFYRYLVETFDDIIKILVKASMRESGGGITDTERKDVIVRLRRITLNKQSVNVKLLTSKDTVAELANKLIRLLSTATTTATATAASVQEQD
jgi:chromosome segregation ATPase